MNVLPASAAAPPRYALRMWLFFAGYFVFGGVAVPFFPVWLDARGLTDVEIAAVIAVPGFLRVVLTPFAGMFADRAPNRRFAVICFTLPAAVIFLFAWPAESFLPILLIVGLSFTVWRLALPVGEALALTGMRRFGLDYGRMRIGGSVVVHRHQSRRRRPDNAPPRRGDLLAGLRGAGDLGARRLRPAGDAAGDPRPRRHGAAAAAGACGRCSASRPS